LRIEEKCKTIQSTILMILFQLMNGDERKIIRSFQQLLTQYELQLIDVPSDGHCFISTIIKYFPLIHHRRISVSQVEQDYLALHRNEETNSLIFESSLSRM